MQELEDWLRSKGLSELVNLFVEQQIRMSDLALLTADDIRELALPIGPRRRLLAALEEMREGGKLSSEPSSLEDARPRIGAERRQLTVMFCDLANSTRLSTKMDPEEYRDLLSSYQDTVRGQIARFDGYIARYMGDGILIYFGYPSAHEDDVERAVRAALGVVGAMQQSSSPTPRELAVRIGIATGPVIAGDIIGEGASEERAVLGETPNLAARLQAAANPNQILIDPATRTLAGQSFSLEDLPPLHLKGFESSVSASVVLSESNAESRFLARPSRTTTLEGRDEELGLLASRWSRTKEGEGQIAHLCGEPGIGKSRLVNAMLELAKKEPHHPAIFQCSPYHSNSPLYPVVRQFELALQHSSIPETGSPAESLRRVLGGPQQASEESVSLILHLLGAELGPDDPVTSLTPPERKERTLEALVNQAVASAQLQPVLLLFEDLHWIDPTTEELLARLANAISDARVMILSTGRPTHRADWMTQFGAALELRLSRLPLGVARALVSQLAHGALSDEVVDGIVARTDGVPLYLEELTRSVLETPKDEHSPIPATLQASLNARLDSLGDARRIAQVASVIGREFSSPLLARALGGDNAETEAELRRLVGSGLVVTGRGASHSTFAFKHALIQDAAYDSLLKRDQAHWHARVAKALEQSEPTQSGAAPEVLAYHWQQADRKEQAVECWTRAGRAAVERSANAEAITHFRSALEIIRDAPSAADWDSAELAAWVGVGPVLMATQGPSSREAEEAYRRAVELTERVGDEAQRFLSTFGLWHMNNVRGLPLVARELANSLLNWTNEERSSGERLQAHHASWSTAFSQGDMKRCIEHIKEGRSMYNESEHADHKYHFAGHDPGMCSWLFGSWAHALMADPSATLHDIRVGSELTHRVDHPYSTSSFFFGSACALYFIGHYDEATKRANEGLEMSRALGLKAWIPVMELVDLSIRGTQSSSKEEFARLGLEMEQVQSRWEGAGAGCFNNWFLVERAKLAVSRGDLDQARNLLDEAQRICEERADLWILPEVLRVRALRDDSAGEGGDCVQILRESIALSRTLGTSLFELRSATSLAKLLVADGGRLEAIDTLQSATGEVPQDSSVRFPDLSKAVSLQRELSTH